MTVRIMSFLWWFNSNKMLLGSTRDDGIPYGLLGGKQEANETPKQTMLREAREEGVSFKDVRCVGYMEETKDAVTIKRYFWEPIGDFVFLEEYKEKHRGIRPIEFTEEQLRAIKEWRAFPTTVLSPDVIESLNEDVNTSTRVETREYNPLAEWKKHFDKNTIEPINALIDSGKLQDASSAIFNLHLFINTHLGALPLLKRTQVETDMNNYAHSRYTELYKKHRQAFTNYENTNKQA